ncbi:MAG TPA: hypothetical protein VHL09_09060 [Dehalococcoidia bacterium]|nr:hypothetical protein [Dehalococcoidia bacterium]
MAQPVGVTGPPAQSSSPPITQSAAAKPAIGSDSPGRLVRPAEHDAGLARLADRLVELQAQAIGQPREIIEDADDVSDLETGAIAEAEIPERLPIRLN